MATFPSGLLNGRILQTIDRVIENRYGPATDLVHGFQRELGTHDPEPVVDRIVRKYLRELATVGAVSGGTAAMPGAGTASAAAISSVDLAFSVGKLCEMVLAIGVAYGHDMDSIDRRRAFVLSVLAAGNGAAAGIDTAAGRLGAAGGARVLAKIPEEALGNVNAILGTRLVTKFATEQGLIRLGRLVPFGIGAAVGGAGNALLVRSVAGAARLFFAEPGTAAPRSGMRAAASAAGKRTAESAKKRATEWAAAAGARIPGSAPPPPGPADDPTVIDVQEVRKPSASRSGD